MPGACKSVKRPKAAHGRVFFLKSVVHVTRRALRSRRALRTIHKIRAAMSAGKTRDKHRLAVCLVTAPRATRAQRQRTCARMSSHPATRHTCGASAGASQLVCIVLKNGFRIAAGYAWPWTGKCAVGVMSSSAIFFFRKRTKPWLFSFFSIFGKFSIFRFEQFCD